MDHPTVTGYVIDPNERLLVDRLRQGDEAALEEIFLARHGELFRLAFRLLNEAELSRDVVQDVFLRLWVKRASLDIRESLAAYLRRAVVNASINELDRRKVRRETSDAFVPASPGSGDASTPYAMEELRRLADRAIDDLPTRTKVVFRLVRNEEMSYREVGEHLGISMKAVEKEMMKAMQLLRKALGDFLMVLLWINFF